MPVPSINEQMYKLQQNLHDNTRHQKVARRELRKLDGAHLDEAYSNLANCHDSQAWKSIVALLGSLCKIGSAGFDPNDSLGKVVSGVGDFFSQGSQVFAKFSEGDMSRIQGKLEQIRELLADDNKRENELQALVRELNEMLQAAIEKAHRMHDSPFHP
jgi:hypothetical protein